MTWHNPEPPDDFTHDQKLAFREALEAHLIDEMGFESGRAQDMAGDYVEGCEIEVEDKLPQRLRYENWDPLKN